MIIGITGSSGAGKTTVCEILNRKYNAIIINCDKIARILSAKGSKYLEEIVENFGKGILLSNGELNRKKLANIIYNNKEKRQRLNSCTFKYIKEEIMEILYALKKENIIIIDAPLLFESNINEICDVNIAVVSMNKNIQLQRIIERDNIDLEHALSRINAQKTNEQYINKCDLVIYNDDEKKDLNIQIEEIMTNILHF